MNELAPYLLLFGAYVLGSIPTSIWIGKIFFNKDIRNYGSKNAGAANTFRVFGTRAGIVVLIVDIAKGFAAVKLAALDPEPFNKALLQEIFRITLGIMAGLGHIMPLFAGLRGGKGVATFLGVALALSPYSTLGSLVVYLIVLLLLRMFSVASMSGGITYPLFIYLFLENATWALQIFAILVALIILFMHRSNIIRILKGEEPRVQLFGKKT